MMGFRVRLWFSLFIDIFLMGLSGLTFCAVVLETTEKVLFHPGVESFPKTAAILLILAVLLISMLWIGAGSCTILGTILKKTKEASCLKNRL